MFLEHLLQRVLGEVTGIAPRRLSRFEHDGADRESAVTESYAEEPTSAVSPAPASRAPTTLPETPDRVESQPVAEHSAERPAPAAPPSVRPVPLVEREMPVPSPTQVIPLMETRAESTPDPVALAPVFAPKTADAAAVLRPITEHHSETIIREKTETKVESRTIERRLESLAREIKHTEELRTTIVAPRESRPETPGQPPRARTVVVPAQTSRNGTPRPMIAETGTRDSAAPSIHVTIGRVEVRAAAPAAAPAKPRTNEPRLSLEEYLRRRERA